MPANEYVFRTEWRVPAAIQEVSDILEDVEALARWWPSVYLEVKTLDQGGEKGIGKKIDLFTKGWLPYTLRWQFVVTESRAPHGFSLDASGDFVGSGVWTLTQDGQSAIVVFDWRIIADKPLLRRLSVVLKPLFRANHEWAMRMGEESLRLELRRRRGEVGVPEPPGPTFRRK